MTPEQINRLFSVYAIERQDDHNALTTSFTVITTAFTYMIAVTAYGIAHCDRSGCPDVDPVIQALVPAIPIALLGFLVLNTATATIRSVHLERLEAILKIPLPGGGEAPHFYTEAGLVLRPDLFGRPRAKIVFGVINLLVYVIVYQIWFLFAFMVLTIGPWSFLKTVFAMVYGVVLAVEMLGFLIPLTHRRFRYEGAGRTI